MSDFTIDFAPEQARMDAFYMLLLNSKSLPFYASVLGCTETSLRLTLESISQGDSASPKDLLVATNTREDLLLRLAMLHVVFKEKGLSESEREQSLQVAGILQSL
jgi:hypothetical protein